MAPVGDLSRGCLKSIAGTQDAEELAERALAAFDDDAFDTHLRPEGHRCPTSDEPMILRTGAFDPFWGCSRYPRCRGVIREAAPETPVSTR